MGMPIESENRRQIAADGTIFEVLEDGTIKRIGKLSEEGKFEPFRMPKNWKCPQCGTENESGNNFCGKCGTKKPEVNFADTQLSAKKCAKCGAPLSDEALFCSNCGAKRKKCCGEFLDAGFKFCPKCGKPVDAEGSHEDKEAKPVDAEEIRENKWAKPVDAEESQEDKEVKPVEQKKTEEQMMMDPDNYIDKGDYIELVHPVGNIRMIQKDCIREKGWLFSYSRFDWEEAMKLAKELGIGGFSDWRVPTKEELEIIYKIKDICGIKKNDDWFWSSSIRSDNTDCPWIVSFEDGYVFDDYKSYSYHVRCVR